MEDVNLKAYCSTWNKTQPCDCFN